MKIRINGSLEELPDEVLNLEALVLKKGLVPERIIAEVNFQIIPREEWFSVRLKDEDRIEIVSFVGGG